MKKVCAIKLACEEIDQDGLPEGWTLASTVDLFRFVTSGSRGWAHYYAESGAVFFRIANLNHDGITIDLSEKKYVQPPRSAEGTRTRVKIRDLLISITADVGMVGLVTDDPGEAYINQHIALARPVEGLDDPYLAWYITSSHGQKQLGDLQRGATKVGLGLDDIKSINVPLAPIDEQRHIVAKINALFQNLKISRDHLSKVPKILRAFRQSVLSSACSGRLTEDWREKYPAVEPIQSLLVKLADGAPQNRGKEESETLAATEELPELPESWEWFPLKSATRRIGDVDHRMPKAEESGIPYISTKDFHDPDAIDFVAAKQITLDSYQALCRKIQPCRGDLLLSRYGTIGEIRLVDFEDLFQASYSIAILKTFPCPSLNRYLLFALRAKISQQQMQAAVRASSQPDLGLKHIRGLLVPLPPLEEQREIVRRVEALFKLADAIEKRVAAATLRADKLTQAILAKAFRGELVPTEAELARREGRDYESASLLLERIKAERQKSNPTNGSRRLRGKAAAAKTST